MDVAQRRDLISHNGGQTRIGNLSLGKNVLERLIEIVIFLAEKNLAFRGSDEVLGSPHNENFLGLFQLLAKRDPVLMELKNRISKHTTKKHYSSNTIQNELIDIVAKKVEKESMTQLTKAKIALQVLTAHRTFLKKNK